MPDQKLGLQRKESILSHDGMRDRFSRLSGSDNEVNNQLILPYIIERYVNMWGTYFVRHLKGNSGNQIQKLADSQATRTKVAHAVFMQNWRLSCVLPGNYRIITRILPDYLQSGQAYGKALPKCSEEKKIDRNCDVLPIVEYNLLKRTTDRL